MPEVRMISLLFANKKAQGLYASLLDAKDGAMVALEPEQMNWFEQMTLFLPIGKGGPEMRRCRSVILYNRRRVRPDTVEAIANAEKSDGIVMVPMMLDEMDSFKQLIFHPGELKKLAEELGQESG